MVHRAVQNGKGPFGFLYKDMDLSLTSI